MGERAFKRFDWQRPSIKLLTMHSAKGLAFPRALVAGLQSLPMKCESLDDAARPRCVAMTPANDTLVLSAHGRSAVVDRLRPALADDAPIHVNDHSTER